MCLGLSFFIYIYTFINNIFDYILTTKTYFYMGLYGLIYLKINKNKKHTPIYSRDGLIWAYIYSMVEIVGIEPTSENLSEKISTCLVDLDISHFNW